MGYCTHGALAPFSRLPVTRLLRTGAAPLVLALAVAQAYAADVTATGLAGQAGADAAGSTIHGGTGGSGEVLTFVLGPNPDAFNSLTITGGNGGTGGAGADGVWDDNIFQAVGAGGGGSGGVGGDATGSVFSVASAADVTALVTVTGGNGGNAGAMLQPFVSYPPQAGIDSGGNGGNASSIASAIASGAASVVARAFAVGGAGGVPSISNVGGASGLGGSAQAQAYGKSDTGNVLVTASARAGDGGRATDNAAFPRQAAVGASVEQINAVAGATHGVLRLRQQAEGGQAGASSWQPDGQGAAGGTARSTLTLSDAEASALIAEVSATGGKAGGTGPTALGGAALADLDIGSTRAGTTVEGSISATGGLGGDGNPNPWSSGGIGGAAEARGAVSGLAAAVGNATATGGNGDGYYSRGGNAPAQLSITAGSLASGTAQAYGGIGGGDLYDNFRSDGIASASLTLVGAGAQGLSEAHGGEAVSNLTATTTGVMAVDVTARTRATTGGVVRATTLVSTGPGSAAVNAVADASGADAGAAAVANVDVNAAGAVTGLSTARGGYTKSSPYPYAFASNSSIRAATSGNHAVTVRAEAFSDIGDQAGNPAYFGVAEASAYGRSGNGVVNVTAEARGGFVDEPSQPNIVKATATAVTEQAGGVSNASALARGTVNEAHALAQGRNRNGQQLGYSASAANSIGDYASAAATNQAANYGLVQADGSYAVTYVGAADAGVTLPPASVLPAAVADTVSLLGVGSHAGGYGGDGAAVYTNTGAFQFTTASSGHLLLGLLSSAFSGDGTLELLIANNGVQIFNQSFASLSAAGLFFSDQLLDLGVFAGGAQNLSITSTLNFAAPGAYAFDYVVGSSFQLGGGVSPTPEPATWLMMSLGMGGMVLLARRRRGRAA